MNFSNDSSKCQGGEAEESHAQPVGFLSARVCVSFPRPVY